MRRLLRIGLSLSALVLAGCGNGSDGSSTGINGEACRAVTPGSKGPGAFDADYARSPAFFTRMESLDVDGSSVHGATRIWYSCNIYGLLDDAELDIPEGTVAIKLQDRDRDGAVDGMRVMVKQAKGSAPAAGDFAYESRRPDGTHPSPQAASFCFGCHQGYPKTGYLAGTALSD
jgi:hypothetical protein